MGPSFAGQTRLHFKILRLSSSPPDAATFGAFALSLLNMLWLSGSLHTRIDRRNPTCTKIWLSLARGLKP
jgi:hypothetical protein